MKKLVVLFVLVLSFLAFETQAQEKGKKAKKEKAKKEVKSEKEKAEKEVNSEKGKAKKEVNSEKGKALGNQTVSFTSSVQCDMCKDKIEKALALTKGVKSSEVNVEANQISITYNSNQVSTDDLKKVISETGYDADDVKANKASHDKLPKCCRKSGE